MATRAHPGAASGFNFYLFDTILPLYHHVRADLLSPTMQGWSPNRLDDHPYKYVWFKE